MLTALCNIYCRIRLYQCAHARFLIIIIVRASECVYVYAHICARTFGRLFFSMQTICLMYKHAFFFGFPVLRIAFIFTGWLLQKKNCHAMSMSSMHNILRTGENCINFFSFIYVFLDNLINKTI